MRSLKSMGFLLAVTFLPAAKTFAAVGDYSNVEIGYVASSEDAGKNYMKILGTTTSCVNSLVKLPTKEMLATVLSAQSTGKPLVRLLIKTIPLEPLSSNPEASPLLAECGCQAVWVSQ